MSHDHYNMPVKADYDPERASQAMKVTWAGVVVNGILTIGKLIAGIVGQSAAMVADAIHSLSDLATDGVVLVTSRVASHGADEKHPYGHGRAETIGTAIVGAALIIVGFTLVSEIISKLVEGNLPTPTWPAIVGAVVSIVANEGLYFYTFRVGKKYDNQMIIANAWHHRSDSLSSVAALLGIVGAMAGHPILDPLAAILVVYMIVKAGWEISSDAVYELMDTIAPPEKMTQIREIIIGVEGARRFHELRTRKVGGDLFVDVHILVAPDITVSEAHNIAETVREKLKQEADVTDALVHIDAEDDIHYKVVDVDRVRIESVITAEAIAIDGVSGVSEVRLHLLNGKLCVDFVVDIADGVTFGEARNKIVSLKQKLVNDGTIDTAVIRGALTKGMLESGFADHHRKDTV
jgi:cation diffusion facilitator family transporter